MLDTDIVNSSPSRAARPFGCTVIVSTGGVKSNVIVPTFCVVAFPAASTTLTVTTCSPSRSSPGFRSRGTVYVQSKLCAAPSGHTADHCPPSFTVTSPTFGSSGSEVVNFTCAITSFVSAAFGLRCGPLSSPVIVTTGALKSKCTVGPVNGPPGFPARSVIAATATALSPSPSVSFGM